MAGVRRSPHQPVECSRLRFDNIRVGRSPEAVHRAPARQWFNESRQERRRGDRVAPPARGGEERRGPLLPYYRPGRGKADRSFIEHPRWPYIRMSALAA